MHLEHRLILALDVPDVDRARSLASEVSAHIDAVKVNWPLLLAGGLDILRELARAGYVLCDLKLADIPNTNRMIVEAVRAAGASGIICHAFAGEDSVRACVEAIRPGEAFVVTEMSHPGGQEFTARHGEEFARLAVRSGAAGIIAPATRPERVTALRRIVGSLLLLAPGVGAQGGRPSDAIRAGADAVIVGRSIYAAPDPRAAAAAIAEEVRRAREGRSTPGTKVA